MGKVRLDALLAERGLFSSRSRAAASVLAGEVRLGDGVRADKPGQLVPDDVEVEVAEQPPFVSRGGVKLANALDATGVSARGRRALDVGASTGGFTDCLLQRGAAHVVALDVGYGELHWRLRTDARVTVLERRNARDVRADELPYRPDLVVVDVSFISLAKVLPAVVAVTAARYDVLALVKPQFEAGRDPAVRRDVLLEVARAAHAIGPPAPAVLGFASSGLPGPKGNRETFVHLAERERGG